MLPSVTDLTFRTQVREYLDPIVVVFTAEWCQPCQKFKPVIETMAERMAKEIKFVQADVEANRNIAQELNIRTLPSLVLFNGGMLIDLHSGTMTQHDIRAWVNENI